jgi:5-methylcytosine-specific restriction protein A
VKIYGEIGNGFIHVHHVVELASVKDEYKVNPVDDLRPVCPNCHAMLHQKKPAYTIEELKSIIKNNK